MANPNHALIGAIRDVLKQHGVTNARVLVELQPSLPGSSELHIVVCGANESPDLLTGAVPAETLDEPPKPHPHPPPRSPRKAAAESPTGGGGSAGHSLSDLEDPPRQSLPKGATRPSPPSSRTTSVTLIEEQQRPEAPVRMTPSGVTPVFSILNTDTASGDAGSRRESTGARTSCSVVIREAVVRPDPHHEPIIGDALEETRRPGILVPPLNPSVVSSQSSSKQQHQQAQEAGAARHTEAEDRRKASTSLPSIGRAGSLEGSKQRLLDLLQEQREMEQQNMESRARHETLVKEAEAYLEELNRVRSERNGGRTSPQTHSRSPRTPLSHPHSPHGTASSSGIQVVKFTMPTGARAKDEVVAQLSTSQGGSQHVTNRDKYSALYREQNKVLRDAEAGEEEYQKLLLQAMSFHKQREQQLAQKRAVQEEPY